MALNLAIFFHYHSVDEVSIQDLLTTICKLSYKGDIRMRMKMENPDKVKNVVAGSLEGLTDLYLPLILETQQKDQQVLKFKNSGRIQFMHTS